MQKKGVIIQLTHALDVGYCFINNTAVATRYLQQGNSDTKVLILDVDYHQ